MIFVMTTYNRPDYVTATLRSLRAAQLYPGDKLHIFDDNSDKTTTDIIIEYIATATNSETALFRAEHLGIHTNCTVSLLEAMERHNSQYAFNIDSDTIFHPQWRDRLEQYMKVLDIHNKPIGCLSLFNTASHPVIGTHSPGLLEKKSLGAFGNLMHIDPIRKLVDMKIDRDWDVVYLQKAREQGLKFYCSENSYLEHIGEVGTNGPVIDKALNFAP